MDQNKTFYVQYLNNQPVGIKTHVFVQSEGEWKWIQNIYTVDELIGASVTEPTRSRIGLPEKLGPISIRTTQTDNRLKPSTKLTDLSHGLDDDDPLIITVKAPSFISPQAIPIRSTLYQGVIPDERLCVVLGLTDGSTGLEGIRLDSVKTIQRRSTVNRIIDQLQLTNVLLVQSPPMTGKTSMAALLTEQLTNIANDANKKTLVINISAVQFSTNSENWNFESAFKNLLDIEFGELETIAKIRDVYLILDEAQLFYTQNTYPNNNNYLNNKFILLWQKVKALFSMNKSPLKIVLFAGYKPSIQYAGLSIPVMFYPEAMFGIELMNFTDAEMSEYVKKYLEVVSFLDVPISSPNGETLCAVEFFCRNLKYLTGSHVGLCCASIKAMNESFHSDMKNGMPLSPQVVFAKLWSESVVNALMLTRAVSVLNLATPDEIDMLKELVSGNEHLDKRIGSACVSKGILIEQNDGFAFASTVMSRYFLLQLNGDPPQRAQFNPLNLKELLVRVFASFDYGHLQLSLGKTKSSGILLERAWQMEFYRKAIQCTADMVTSADVGALFNSRGSIDFTIHSEDMSDFWGIVLLREADKIADHCERFAAGGRYSSLCLRLTESCLIDFRLQTADMRNLNDIFTFEGLYIVTYNSDFSSVLLYSRSEPLGKKIERLF